MTKKTPLIGLYALGLLLCAVPALAATPPAGKLTGGQISQHPAWFKESFLDITEDVAEAAESDKHVILFMHLNGCPYCYKMTEENFKNAPYVDFIREKFDVIAINIKGDREIAFDEETSVTEKELAKILKVRATPTTIFLNAENKPVTRLNGYRSVEAFKHALDYVATKSYQRTSLSAFIQEQEQPQRYSFRDHPQIKEISDLKSVASSPLALLFEEPSCDACNALHDGHLANPEIREVLKNFTLVRLDASSDKAIIDIEGNATTPRAYAEKLGLTYRPGIILIDKGREVTRIDGLLYTYHFRELLRYVGERHYEKYPNSFFDYLTPRTEQILQSGQNIDLSK